MGKKQKKDPEDLLQAADAKNECQTVVEAESNKNGNTEGEEFKKKKESLEEQKEEVTATKKKKKSKKQKKDHEDPLEASYVQDEKQTVVEVESKEKENTEINYFEKDKESVQEQNKEVLSPKRGRSQRNRKGI